MIWVLAAKQGLNRYICPLKRAFYLDTLLHFDEWLFSLMNGAWRADWLDAIAPLWRNKYLWVPFYLFILSIVVVNFRQIFLPFLLCAVLTVTVADTLSSKIIKPTVKRDRPCKSEALPQPKTLLINCGAGYSFTSSHATNHFAIAVFFMMTLGSIFPRTKALFLLWAGSISYGQVYVGVHYPLDILGGTIVGTLIGIGTSYLFNRYWSLSTENLDPIA
jgi:undecaprenyl-diphosphatase